MSATPRVRPQAPGFGLAALVGGFLVILAVQLGRPTVAPLYDGVVVTEPYRYAAPTSGEPGAPTSYDATTPVSGATNPSIPAATTENPPQAQLIIPPGGIALTPSATAIHVTIEPVAPTGDEADSLVAGNVYRITVTDQSGTPLSPTPGTLWTVVLRAPSGVTDATVGRFATGAWQQLATSTPSQPGIFLTNSASAGDFAILIPAAGGPFGLDPGLAAAAFVVLAVGVVLVASSRLQRRRSGLPAPAADRARRHRLPGSDHSA